MTTLATECNLRLPTLNRSFYEHKEEQDYNECCICLRTAWSELPTATAAQQRRHPPQRRGPGPRRESGHDRSLVGIGRRLEQRFVFL